MKVAVVYAYPPPNYPSGPANAARYVTSYHECDPGYEHQSIVVCNGAPADGFVKMLFGGLQNLAFLQHDNSGWDIGAFQMAARTITCDLMVFMGSSAWVTRKGWLSRMVQAVERHGFGQYGCMGNAGDPRVAVSPHIRTTGFWIQPSLLNKYPFVCKQPHQRYAFEHGRDCLTTWVTKQGLQSWVTTWHGTYLQHQWDLIPSGFHRGDQSSLIVKDRLCEPPFYG